MSCPVEGCSAALELRTQGCELVGEVLVATVDDPEAAHRRTALRSERRDEVAEATAQVGDLDLGRVQRRGPGDDGRVVEVALPEAARAPAETLLVHLDRRAHPAQRLREPEAVLVH